MGAPTLRFIVLVPALLFIAGCSERRPNDASGPQKPVANSERPSARPGELTAPGRLVPEPPPTMARVDRALRIELGSPVRFRAGGGESLETAKVLLLKVAVDPKRFFEIGEQRRYWFFNRARVQLVSRGEDHVVLAVPDPGAGLASAVLWQTDPSVAPPSAAEVRARLAEISRGTRRAVRLGDGKAVRVDVGEPRKVESLDALRQQAGELWGKQP